MALTGFYGDGNRYEINPTAKTVLSGWTRVRGDYSTEVTALRTPGLAATELDDVADHYPDYPNSWPATPSTDKSWFFEDFQITAHTTGKTWHLWLLGRRSASLNLYAVSAEYDTAQSVGSRIRFKLLRVVFDGSAEEGNTINVEATGTNGYNYGINTTYRIAIRADKTSPYPVEVWIETSDGTWVKEIDYAGNVLISGVLMERMSRYQWEAGYVAKGGTPAGFTSERQNAIWMDESGSGDFDGTRTGGSPDPRPSMDSGDWGVVQLMPESNGATMQWDPTPTTYGDAGAYYLLADANRATDPLGDDYIEAPGADKDALFNIQDVHTSCTDVEAICVLIECIDNVTSWEYTITDTGGSQTGTFENTSTLVRHQKLLTAASAAAWTESLLNSVTVQIERPTSGSGTWRAHQMYVEALVKDVSTNPSAIAEPPEVPTSLAFPRNRMLHLIGR